MYTSLSTYANRIRWTKIIYRYKYICWYYANIYIYTYIQISDACVCVCACGHDGHVMPRDDLAAPTPCCLGETFLEKANGGHGVFTPSKQMIYRHGGGNKKMWKIHWKNPVQKINMTSTIDLLWMVGFWHVNADRRVTWKQETRKELFPQDEFPGGYSLFFVLWRHMVKLRGCTLWSSCAKNRFMWWS